MTGKLRYVLILTGLVILFCALWVAYEYHGSGTLLNNRADSEGELLHVRLVFSDDESVEAYVKGLGIEEDSILYSGGSSCNYFYDQDGNLMGAFNYQRLLYILLLPEPAAS